MKLKVKLIIFVILLSFIMLLVPHLASVAMGENGMAVCFLLFFAVDPLFALVSGILSGRDARRLWALVPAVPVTFLIGIFINFGFGEPLFLLYAAIYLAIGLVAMSFTMLIKKAIAFSMQGKR